MPLRNHSETESLLKNNSQQAFCRVNFWRRFHIRMSGMYGLIVFLVLALMGVTFFKLGVAEQKQALQSRIRTAAVSISHQISLADLRTLNTESDSAKPEYRRITGLFKAIAADDPQFVSIYLLKPTLKPNILKFAADFTAPGWGTPASVGEEYDALKAKHMLSGLEHPTVENKPVTDRWGTALSGYAPVRDADGKSVALVGVDVSYQDLIQMEKDVFELTLSIFGVAALCLGLLAIYVGRSIRNPLGSITFATNQIAAGHLDTRLNIVRTDEFGVLANNLDSMAEGLGEREVIRATFGRFVSEDVARRILASPDGSALGGEERMVTILLTDLVGYSTLSEKLSPSDVVKMLNEYFAIMGEVIERHYGCVIEFPGDGVLCVFGAPANLPDHADHAVACAVEMREKLKEANKEWKMVHPKVWHGQGDADLKMRIGIHTGSVIAGNIGTRNRVKYTVIGDSVNVAARLEQLNKETGTDILFTEETLIRIHNPLRSMAVARGVHSIKGRNHSVTVHSL
jgi:adenylate cyclase